MRPPQQLPPPRMAAQPPQQIVQQGALLVSSPPPAGSQAAHSSLQTPPSGSLNRRRWPPSVNSGGTSAARPAGPAVPALPLAAASHFGPSPTAASGPTTVHLQQQVATPTEGLNSQHQHLIALTSPSPTTSGRVAVTQPPVPAGHARGSDLRHINPHHGQPAATNGLFSGPGAAGSNLRHPQQLLPPQGQQQQQQNLPGLLPSPTRSLAPLARRFVDGGGSHQPTGAPPTTGNPGGATASSAPFATPSSGAVGGGQNSLAASQQPSSAVGQIPLQAGGAHMLAANGRPPRAGGATIPQGSVDGGPGVMVSATGGNDSNAARQYPGADPQQQKQDYGTVAAGAPPPGRTRGALGQQRPPIMHGPIGMPVSRSSESKGSPQHATAVSQLQAPLQHLHQQHPQGASPTPAFKGAGSAAGTRGHQRAPHQVSSAASKGAGGGPNFKNNENGIQSPQSAATPGRGTPQTHRTTGGRSSAGGASVSTSVGGASNGTTATTVTQMSTIRGRKYNHWRMQRDPQSVVQSMLLSSRHSYRLDRLLQTAIYGAVYHATEINQQGYKRAVAIKIMVKETERRNRGTLQEDMFAEMKFHKELKGHPNLLVYDYCWDDKDCVYVVMPYAEYEDLFEVLKKRKVPLAEREARWLFAQILDGTAYLNSKGVAFRDHSLENVLMFHNPEDGTVFPKITDPGQAVSFQVDAQHRVKGLVADKLFGKSFRPPEVYSKRPYNPVKIDTFCLAWMLFFAVTKHQAFDRAVDSDAHWSLIKRGRFSELLKARGGSNLSPVLCDLIQKMLNPDHAHRPSPRQCLDHRWFKHGHKCPLDDRTIHGQAGVTADRLPRHPLLVRKMERQKKQQEAGGGPGAENVGGASPAGGDKLPIYEPFRRRESEPKHQQQKPAQIPHAPSAAAENVDTNLHLAQQQQQSSPSSRSTMKRSHHHVPREGGAVARASLANQVILNVTASNSAAAAGGQSSPQQPPADAGVYSARADLSLATSPAKTTAQQQVGPPPGSSSSGSLSVAAISIQQTSQQGLHPARHNLVPAAVQTPPTGQRPQPDLNNSLQQAGFHAATCANPPSSLTPIAPLRPPMMSGSLATADHTTQIDQQPQNNNSPYHDINSSNEGRGGFGINHWLAPSPLTVSPAVAGGTSLRQPVVASPRPVPPRSVAPPQLLQSSSGAPQSPPAALSPVSLLQSPVTPSVLSPLHPPAAPSSQHFAPSPLAPALAGEPLPALKVPATTSVHEQTPPPVGASSRWAANQESATVGDATHLPVSPDGSHPPMAAGTRTVAGALLSLQNPAARAPAGQTAHHQPQLQETLPTPSPPFSPLSDPKTSPSPPYRGGIGSHSLPSHDHGNESTGHLQQLVVMSPPGPSMQPPPTMLDAAQKQTAAAAHQLHQQPTLDGVSQDSEAEDDDGSVFSNQSSSENSTDSDSSYDGVTDSDITSSPSSPTSSNLVTAQQSLAAIAAQQQQQLSVAPNAPPLSAVHPSLAHPANASASLNRKVATPSTEEALAQPTTKNHLHEDFSNKERISAASRRATTAAAIHLEAASLSEAMQQPRQANSLGPDFLEGAVAAAFGERSSASPTPLADAQTRLAAGLLRADGPVTPVVSPGVVTAPPRPPLGDIAAGQEVVEVSAPSIVGPRSPTQGSRLRRPPSAAEARKAAGSGTSGWQSEASSSRGESPRVRGGGRGLLSAARKSVATSLSARSSRSASGKALDAVLKKTQDSDIVDTANCATAAVSPKRSKSRKSSLAKAPPTAADLPSGGAHRPGSLTPLPTSAATATENDSAPPLGAPVSGISLAASEHAAVQQHRLSNGGEIAPPKSQPFLQQRSSLGHRLSADASISISAPPNGTPLVQQQQLFHQPPPLRVVQQLGGPPQIHESPLSQHSLLPPVRLPQQQQSSLHPQQQSPVMHPSGLSSHLMPASGISQPPQLSSGGSTKLTSTSVADLFRRSTTGHQQLPPHATLPNTATTTTNHQSALKNDFRIRPLVPLISSSATTSSGTEALGPRLQQPRITSSSGMMMTTTTTNANQRAANRHATSIPPANQQQHANGYPNNLVPSSVQRSRTAAPLISKQNNPSAAPNVHEGPSRQVMTSAVPHHISRGPLPRSPFFGQQLANTSAPAGVNHHATSTAQPSETQPQLDLQKFQAAQRSAHQQHQVHEPVLSQQGAGGLQHQYQQQQPGLTNSLPAATTIVRRSQTAAPATNGTGGAMLFYQQFDKMGRGSQYDGGAGVAKYGLTPPASSRAATALPASPFNGFHRPPASSGANGSSIGGGGVVAPHSPSSKFLLSPMAGVAEVGGQQRLSSRNSSNSSSAVAWQQQRQSAPGMSPNNFGVERNDLRGGTQHFQYRHHG